MNTRLGFKLRHRATLQTVLTSAVLRMSQDELAQAILREMREGLGLVPDGSFNAASPTSGESSDQIELLTSHETATDFLLSQLRLMIAEDDLDVAIYLVQSLDQHGYLTVSAQQVAADMRVTPQQATHVMAALRELDPPGIGARDMRDCFLLQCADLESREIDCQDVYQIVSLAWDDFMHQRWLAVARCTGLSLQRVEAARQFMQRHLYPHPLSLIQTQVDVPVIVARADLCIRAVTNHPVTTYQVEIPDEQRYRLAQNPVLPMSERARGFLFALQQRWATLHRIGAAIIAHQTDFLRDGPRHLKPLTRAALARELGLHESTISRAIADKFVQLPDGRTRPLAELFDPSCAAKAALSDIVARSPNSLSDEAIALQLRNQGFHLARRTVAKYRNALGLSPRNHREVKV